ncbi:hypothetical protein PGT21_008905 [Puccinia graminis f. sp. tritici]|uniref:Uncharacterized protein n=1 Tax=Puccinia graminis f. sp. tritici TaxID=56615 RepID=A0A5B0NLE3_PUCGR|nr:hypothetical protein PGT21_008905 [Puccinia graminis f. sp. tritici]KAA1090067.1 hypothetical protein PGTUg99_034983 [Puccinia graminis f. sp. tritici]
MVDSTNEPGSTVSISKPEEVEVEITGKNGVVSGLEHGREGDTNRAEKLQKNGTGEEKKDKKKPTGYELLGAGVADLITLLWGRTMLHTYDSSGPIF